jgi:hypothetical protein
MKLITLFFVLFFGLPSFHNQTTCEEVKDVPINGMKTEVLMSNLQLCGVDRTEFPLVGAFLIDQLQKEGSLGSLTHGDVIIFLDSLRSKTEYKMLNNN